MARTKTCACCDPVCPTHPKVSRCANAGTLVLFRVDMQDRTGTLFCEDCAGDAQESGLFTTVPA